MSKSKKADVLLQFVFTLLAVFIAGIVGSVVWIRGFNAHLQTMEDDVKASHREDTGVNAPYALISGNTAPGCVCTPYHATWRCGDGTDCAPDERIWTEEPCNPVQCDPDTEICVADTTCCEPLTPTCDPSSGDISCCGANVLANGTNPDGSCPDGELLRSAMCQSGEMAYDCFSDPGCEFSCNESPSVSDTMLSLWCHDPESWSGLLDNHSSSYVDQGSCDPNLPPAGPWCEIECQDPFLSYDTTGKPGCDCPGEWSREPPGGNDCRCPKVWFYSEGCAVNQARDDTCAAGQFRVN